MGFDKKGSKVKTGGHSAWIMAGHFVPSTTPSPMTGTTDFSSSVTRDAAGKFTVDFGLAPRAVDAAFVQVTNNSGSAHVFRAEISSSTQLSWRDRFVLSGAATFNITSGSANTPVDLPSGGGFSLDYMFFVRNSRQG